MRKEFRGRIGMHPRRIRGQGHLAHHLPDRNSEGNRGHGRVNPRKGRKSQLRVRWTTRKSRCRLASCHTQDMRGRRSEAAHMCRLAPYSATKQGTDRFRNPTVRLRFVCRRGLARLTRRSRSHSELVMVCRRREKRAHSRTQTRERSR